MNIYQYIKNKVFRKTSELDYLINHGMKIGEKSYINDNCVIDSQFPWLIEIGDNVTISSNVTILAHDASTNVVGCGTKIAKVKIGNNVFIGTKSIILCGSTIGNNVIIGAGSVVTNNLEDNYVYAGVPAHKICNIEEYKEKNINKNFGDNDFRKLKKWYEWKNCSKEDREYVLSKLKDNCGFI